MDSSGWRTAWLDNPSAATADTTTSSTSTEAEPSGSDSYAPTVAGDTTVNANVSFDGASIRRHVTKVREPDKALQPPNRPPKSVNRPFG